MNNEKQAGDGSANLAVELQFDDIGRRLNPLECPLLGVIFQPDICGCRGNKPIPLLFLYSRNVSSREFNRQHGEIPKEEATMRMNKSKAFIIAVFALGLTSGVNAQQPPAAPPQLPQAPNMTFFVTGNGPGKGADLGGIEGADQHCQMLAQRHGAEGKPGAHI